MQTFPVKTFLIVKEKIWIYIEAFTEVSVNFKFS